MPRFGPSAGESDLEKIRSDDAVFCSRAEQWAAAKVREGRKRKAGRTQDDGCGSGVVDERVGDGILFL